METLRRKEKIEKITIDSKWYPTKLREISKPPQVLYVEGNKKILSTNSISIIGSRLCSNEGKKIAKKFAKDLVNQNITIVSGMANGIDTSAHIGALEANGITIAVLGSGFEHIYPTENIPLFHKIVASGGAVITEYLPNTYAKSAQFLERNRIVSGLSMGTLVVEAAYRSGTSVTAKIAEEQGRKVFCLPHETNNIHGIRYK